MKKNAVLALMLGTYAVAIAGGCAAGSQGGLPLVAISPQPGPSSCPTSGGGNWPMITVATATARYLRSLLSPGCPGTVPVQSWRAHDPGRKCPTNTSDPIERALTEAATAQALLSNLPPPNLSVNQAASAGNVGTPAPVLSQSTTLGSGASAAAPGAAPFSGNTRPSSSGFAPTALTTTPADTPPPARYLQIHRSYPLEFTPKVPLLEQHPQAAESLAQATGPQSWEAMRTILM